MYNRKNQRTGYSAAQWLNHAKEKEIADVIHEYGEERKARRIAAGIVRRRAQAPLETTGQLADLVMETVPRTRKMSVHPATKTFQAIRIFINQELRQLRSLLSFVPQALAKGGRLVVICFHSLEDRMVKRFIRDQSRGSHPAKLPLPADAMAPSLCPVGRMRRPSAQELRRNPRARSAVLRAAERI